MKGERQRVPQAIVPYRVGPLSMSICAPNEAAIEEVERTADELHPTGLERGWEKSEQPTFSGGEPHPCPCNNEPERRQHWLLVC